MQYGPAPIRSISLSCIPATQFPLTVNLIGNGQGSVHSSPAGINCLNGTCSFDFLMGTTVTLTPQIPTLTTFLGWSGACSGTGPCTVTMDAAKSVTANFKLAYPLHVTLVRLSPNPCGGVFDPPCVQGGGSVVSTTGINCTTQQSCPDTSYDAGTVVTLTATAAASSTFVGWFGQCTGTGPCVVTMDGVRSVTAAFQRSGF